MTRTWMLSLGVLALAGGSLLWAQAPPAAFAVAEYKDEIEGDRPGAIAEYLKVAQTAAPAVAAEALLRAADIYANRLRDPEAARRLYHQIVEGYRGQDAATHAEERLARMQPRTSAPGAVVGPIPASRVALTPDGLTPVSISADGRWMTLDRGQGAESWIRNLETGDSRLVSRDADVPAVSRNGRLLAYHFFGTDDLGGMSLRLAVNEPGGRVRVLRTYPPDVRYMMPYEFSMDDSSLLVLITNRDWTRQLAWLSVETSDPPVVLKSLDWRHRNMPVRDRRPMLSPDGRYIAYAALAGSPPAPGQPIGTTDQHIYILAADGSTESAVVTGNSINRGPAWTPDGMRVMFLSNRGGEGTALWSVGLRSGRVDAEPVMVRRLPGNSYSIGIDPAGSYYYLSEPEPVDHIYIADADPRTGAITDVRRLTEAATVLSARGASWSPDGELIAFKRATEDGRFQIGVQSLRDGGEIVYPGGLPPGPSAGPAPWLGDSRALLEWCASRCPGPAGFYQLDLDTQAVRLVAAADAAAPLRLSTLHALSPREAVLYVVLREPDAPAGAGGNSNQIAALRVFDGHVMRIFPVPEMATIRGIALDPDGATLAVTGTPVQRLTEGRPDDGEPNMADFEMQLAVIAVDGSGHRVLHRPILTRETGNLPQALTWTKDGHYILFGHSGDYTTGDWATNVVSRIAVAGGLPEPTGLTLQAGGLGGYYIDFDPSGTRLVFHGRQWFVPEVRVLELAAQVPRAAGVPAK